MDARRLFFSTHFYSSNALTPSVSGYQPPARSASINACSSASARAQAHIPPARRWRSVYPRSGRSRTRRVSDNGRRATTPGCAPPERVRSTTAADRPPRSATHATGINRRVFHFFHAFPRKADARRPQILPARSPNALKSMRHISPVLAQGM